jgi:hypothetical protein
MRHDATTLTLSLAQQPVCARNSASFSDGVMNPRVLRGLPLRLRAMRARSSAVCTDRSIGIAAGIK